MARIWYDRPPFMGTWEPLFSDRSWRLKFRRGQKTGDKIFMLKLGAFHLFGYRR